MDLTSAILSKINQVSIPFKRESGAKVLSLNIRQKTLFVSIPFKRESGAKVKINFLAVFDYELFQFPSNGKVEPKS